MSDTVGAVARALAQLLVSGAASFVGAACIALLAARLFRLPEGRARLAVLLVPFAKLVLELARGIPATGFFWLKTQGARQELGGFHVGFGLDHFVPVVNISLSARYRGGFYPQSAADVLAGGLERHVGPHAVAIFGGALALAVLLGGGRALVAFARRDRHAWRDGASRIDTRMIGWRRAAIMTSARWQGVPFATGIVAPVVCLPERVDAALSPEEREAVIQHELAHLRGLHGVIVAATSLLASFFWFVPGVTRVAREVRAQVEVCADDAAVRAGVAPEALASAVVSVAALITTSSGGSEPALALFGRRSVIARRVERLLGARPPVRWRVVALRAVGLLIVAATVLRATTLGNP